MQSQGEETERIDIMEGRMAWETLLMPLIYRGEALELYGRR